MSDPSQTETKDIQERRLANAFDQHRKIQDTLDDQQKERDADKRFAIIGIVILIVIAAVALYIGLSGESTVISGSLPE